ncbi:batten's disease protein Cln3 [Trichophaea hybrida]|nr:batten's disease protein Cln3 [Trichophaea hybrida]
MESPPASSVAHSLSGPFSTRRARSPALSLPVPGAPSASLALYKARVRAAFVGANPRVCAAFFLFGLINNVIYVIILSAALDLVGPTLPKAIVLLADVVPSLFVKLIAPYLIHLLPYRIRVLILVALSFVGMQLVAWQEKLPARLFGVVLASMSSGLGELSFLGMTHFYGQFAVPFWGSGTGAAGLLGAGLYVCATSWIKMPVRASIMTFGFLPVIMLVAFFGVLPQGPLISTRKGYEPIAEREGEDEEDVVGGEDGSLLASSMHSASSHTFAARSSPKGDLLHNLAIKLKRTSKLFFPYMLPLLLVYIAEYTVNQGVAPTLLYPLSKMPFAHYRDAYPMYGTVYQIGVFISRSSTPFIRVRALYPPAFLQIINLVVLTLHAMFDFIPSIWIIFAIIFWEGLLGGLVYVNTFAEITDVMEGEEREFSLGATTVSDSTGICIAGFISMGLEPFLCGWQVERGRKYCRMI